ncbi:MAG: MacS family sensor histidine kinase [Actinomycetes bacterium]
MGIETAVWRALAVFRALGLGYAVVLYSLRHDGYDHPGAGWLVVGLMAVWTLATAVLYRSPAGRTWPVLALDLALAAGAVVATVLVDDPARIDAGAATLPAVWAAAPVIAWAIRGGWPAGVGAASVIAAADLVHRGSVTATTANNIVLLYLAGLVVGYVVALARRGELALARALAVAATNRERERLARDIHDGVLQVLALVGRRGRELGGDAAELGRLAAEQELSLRALVSTPAEAAGEEVDLRGLLSSYASDVVVVSTPATPVLVTYPRARELAAAVGAALANVAAHAGEKARAWVLLEDEGDEVVVSVRDDGVGFAPDRLAAAEADGRLGVTQSIGGRARDLGGTWRLDTAPGQGTEVELRVPRVAS